MIRISARWLLAFFFILAGWNHFRDPGLYLGMMPPWLPWPMGLILVSGGAEIAGGVGALIPGLRRLAGWGLMVLLVAVLPANIQMLLNHGLPGKAIPDWVLWVRLPMQLVLMAWVWWTSLAKPDPRR